MPLTPFHLGPAVLVGALCYRFLDFPTLLVASVVVDIRAALVLFGPLDPPVHGVLTTFAGATAVALLLTVAVLATPGPLQDFLDALRPAGTNAPTSVVGAAIVGLWSHVLLDGMLYSDVRPFYPSEWNPFLLGPEAFALVYGGCIVAGVLGVGLLGGFVLVGSP